MTETIVLSVKTSAATITPVYFSITARHIPAARNRC
jgi:hypothetical protein